MKKPRFLDPIIQRLYGVKTIDELHKIMTDIIGISVDILINQKSDCPLGPKFSNVLLAALMVLDAYFDVINHKSTTDPMIIAYNIAEQLELLQKQLSQPLDITP